MIKLAFGRKIGNEPVEVKGLEHRLKFFGSSIPEPLLF